MYVARTTNTTYCNKLCMLSSCMGQCASSSSSKQQPSAAASTLRRRGRHPGEALAILAAGYTAANMLQHYHIAEPELKPAL